MTENFLQANLELYYFHASCEVLTQVMNTKCGPPLGYLEHTIKQKHFDQHNFVQTRLKLSKSEKTAKTLGQYNQTIKPLKSAYSLDWCRAFLSF